MAKKNNPHDHYFKKFMAEPDIARDFIKQLFPAEIVAKIDLNSLTEQKESFILPELKEIFSDVVFKVNIKNQGAVQIAILFEHKSYPDDKVTVQMLLYLAQAYFQQLKSKKNLELIIPVLYYHGKKRWQPKKLHELVNLSDKNLLKFSPKWEHLFIDLPRIEDDTLRTFTNNFLTLALFLQKRAEHNERSLRSIMVHLQAVDGDEKLHFFYSSFVYLLQKTPESINLQQEFLNLPPTIKTTAMSAYDKLLAEGVLKGRQEGVENTKYQTTINMINKGFNDQIIIEVLDVDAQFVESIRQELNDNSK